MVRFVLQVTKFPNINRSTLQHFNIQFSNTNPIFADMNILLLGSGGRESAFAWKMSQS
ncbi:MAG: hypothetical protein EOO95_15370, partial [Pedobacter sp.]